MTINSVDGRFGLDMWPSRGSKIEQLSEFSEDFEELTDRAGVLFKGGRLKHLELCEWRGSIERCDGQCPCLCGVKWWASRHPVYKLLEYLTFLSKLAGEAE
jgi:hypothetical protein